MRSELIFGALTYVSNRFLLTRLASKATRSFHRPNTRIEKYLNVSLTSTHWRARPMPVTCSRSRAPCKRRLVHLMTI
jgi:hypothetical protein